MASSATFRSALEPSYMRAPIARALDHIPGDNGWPIMGRTISLVRDLPALCQEHMDRFGSVSRIGLNFHRGVLVLHPDDLQQFYMDPDKNLSSTMGYEPSLGPFFGGAFIFQDFDVHMSQRRLFQRSFGMDSLEGYLEMMSPVLVDGLDDWASNGTTRFHTGVKLMLLDVAARVFLGLEDLRGDEARSVHKAYKDISEKGALSLIKRDIPGLKYHAAQRGKRFLHDYFTKLLPQRRAAQGQDMASLLAQETDEHGEHWPVELLVPHLALIQFAAHDTTSGALSHLVMHLAHPDNHALQEELREIAFSREYDRDHLTAKELRSISLYENCVQEALRLHPSLALLPRRTIRECELGGHRIPPHTMVYAAPSWAHRSTDWWTDPMRFDPHRFSAERAEHRGHRFCYVPFGGGAHKCIGMHFALLNSKLFLHQFLRRYRFRLPKGYDLSCRSVPIAAPSKGLPLLLERIA